MGKLLIRIGSNGFELSSMNVGVSPKIEDIESALKVSPSRTYRKYDNRRELHLFDSLGLSILCDSSSGIVYWFSIMFEYPSWREVRDSDAEYEFSGSVFINKIPLSKPVSIKQAEAVRYMDVGALEFDFVPHGNTIAELTISFGAEPKGSGR